MAEINITLYDKDTSDPDTDTIGVSIESDNDLFASFNDEDVPELTSAEALALNLLRHMHKLVGDENVQAQPPTETDTEKH